MRDILVPISNPGEIRWAIDQVIGLYRQDPARIHLLNVQRPLPRHISQFFTGGDLHDFHRDAGMALLEPAIRMLDEAGIPHQDHVLVGSPAQSIVTFAEEHGCSQVVLDTASRSLLSVFGLGSIGSQVRHLMEVHAAAASTSGVSNAT